MRTAFSVSDASGPDLSSRNRSGTTQMTWFDHGGKTIGAEDRGRTGTGFLILACRPTVDAPHTHSLPTSFLVRAVQPIFGLIDDLGARRSIEIYAEMRQQISSLSGRPTDERIGVRRVSEKQGRVLACL